MWYKKPRKDRRSGRRWVKPEGSLGIRDRDFEEKICLESERTSGGIYRETISLQIVKRIAGSSVRLQRIKDLTLWRGQIPPKQLKSLLTYLAYEEPEMWECRPLGIVLAPPLGKKKTLDDGDAPGSNGTLSGSRSGQSALKEGAVVVVGEWSPWERPSHNKTSRADTSGKKEQRHTKRLFGMNSLKEGAM
jgi:hypothetical protein